MPVTVIGDQAVVGFNRPALAAALEIEAAARTTVDTATLLGQYQTIFGAFSRAARQLDDDRLDWKSPERDRRLREFLFHVYHRPVLMLRGRRTGVYRYEDLEEGHTQSHAFLTTRALVDRGDELLDGVYEFLRAATPEQMAQPIDSYQGVLAVGELLRLGLGHAAHHLRQLYHYLGLLGIAPAAPLGDREFEGIPLPSKLF